MILEKIEIHLSLNSNPEYYLKIYTNKDAEPRIMGPAPKGILDDIACRIMEAEAWKENAPDSETLPEAHYVHEMGLTYFK